MEDADHPGPTTMNFTVEIVSPQRKSEEVLTLDKISPLKWQHNDGIELYVSIIQK